MPPEDSILPEGALPDSRVSFKEIADEIQAHMEKYSEFADVTLYNPTNSQVPHILVLIKTPKADNDLPQAQYEELKSMNMVLKNPEFVYRQGKSQIDFEPTYEGVLDYYDIPLPVLERQKGVFLKNPASRTLQVPFEFFEDSTVLDRVQEEHRKKVQYFEGVKVGLDARQPIVYVPKDEKTIDGIIYTDDGGDYDIPRRCISYNAGKCFKQLPVGSTLLPDGSVVLPRGKVVDADDVRIKMQPTRQTKVTKLETNKYWMKEREDGFRVLRNDLIYHLPSSDSMLLAEVKPWGAKNDEEVRGRFFQCQSYHNMLCYFGDKNKNVPIALTIPTLASPTEHSALEVLHKETGRQILVLTVAERGYFIKATKKRVARCEEMLDLAKNMDLKEAKKVFNKRVNNLKDALKLVDGKKDELMWYQRGLSQVS
jgi:hypothetical protein